MEGAADLKALQARGITHILNLSNYQQNPEVYREDKFQYLIINIPVRPAPPRLQRLAPRRAGLTPIARAPAAAGLADREPPRALGPHQRLHPRRAPLRPGPRAPTEPQRPRAHAPTRPLCSAAARYCRVSDRGKVGEGGGLVEVIQ